MHAALGAEGIHRAHQFRRKHGSKLLAKRLRAAQRIHRFHLRVPAFDPPFQIHRQNSHVDRLDDVLVELLQPLEFGDLVLKPRIQ